MVEQLDKILYNQADKFLQQVNELIISEDENPYRFSVFLMMRFRDKGLGVFHSAADISGYPKERETQSF